MKFSLLLIALTSFVLLASEGDAQIIADQGLINGIPLNDLRDRELYRAACGACHGLDGKGNPRSIVGFDVELPDLTDCRFTTPEADLDWYSVIHNGGPTRAFARNMPAFGNALSDEQIDSVVDYIRGFCTETGWPRGDLNLPRPLVTEKAFPENEAVMTTSITRRPTSIASQFVYERRVGKRGQYEIAVPFVQKRDISGWNRGVGDAELSYKHVLLHSLRRGSIISAGGALVVPTGKESIGLGQGRKIGEGFAAFGQILPNDAFVHLQGGFERPITRDKVDTESFWRMTLGKTFAQERGLGRAWSPMVEALGARVLGAGETARWDLLPQMQVSLSKRQHILLNAGLRFPLNERKDRSKTFVIYLLWDWFDGGLLSGW